MIRPSQGTQIYLYRDPVDMRKAINGLVAIVEGEMQLDPFNFPLIGYKPPPSGGKRL